MAWVVNNPPDNEGDIRDWVLISGLGRSLGGGHSNPDQYSWLENPMDRGGWRATVHRVTKSQTWLKWLSMHAQLLKKGSTREGHSDLPLCLLKNRKKSPMGKLLKPCNSDWDSKSVLTEITHMVSGLNETQVLDVSSQKEFKWETQWWVGSWFI